MAEKEIHPGKGNRPRVGRKTFRWRSVYAATV